jgi:hypothetical protein
MTTPQFMLGLEQRDGLLTAIEQQLNEMGTEPDHQSDELDESA